MGLNNPPLDNFSRVLSKGSLTTRFGLPGWNFPNAAGTTRTPVAHTIYFAPFYIGQPWAFDQIVAEVTTGGGGGTLARLGLYNATLDASGGLTPGSLLVDAGTIDANSATIQAKTITQTLNGWYFAAFVTQAGIFRAPAGTVQVNVPINIWATSFAMNSAPENYTSAILLTAATPGSDWPANGLPATAPAIAGMAEATRLFTLLRTSA